MPKLMSLRKLLTIISTMAFTGTVLMVLQMPYYEHSYVYHNQNSALNYSYIFENETLDISHGKWRGLIESEEASLSVLGRILFLEEPPPRISKQTNKTYKILVWKYGPTIESRHLKHFTNKKYDPFEHCSARNCEISYKDSDITSAEIVIFHLHMIKGLGDLPKGPRNSSQIWAFLTDESPYHTFMASKNSRLNDFNGMFNWSMTYRMDSDIPVPYGRTVTLQKPLDYREKPWAGKRRDVLVAIMSSNCGGNNHRWDYLKEMQKYIKIDVYGKCGTLKCPGHFRKDCPEISKYLFYLAFENSNCKEYATEKLWWNALGKDAIPVVMGASKSYRKLLPPGSYVDVADFARPADLAKYILYVNKTNEFEKFFRWRRRFKILNEHGYFQTQSYHYCRVCEALNYNKWTTKVYSDLHQFWSVDNDCTQPWDTLDAR